MRNSTTWLTCVFFVAALAASCTSAPSELVGRQLDFRLPTLEGELLGPPDLSGKVVILEMWATWCAPCHVQAATLERLGPDLDSRGATVVSVNVGEGRELVAEHLAKKPSRWPNVLDEDERVSRDLGVVALPTLLVLDGAGKVRSVEVGVRSARVILELVDAARR